MADRSSFVEQSTLELPVVPLRDMVVFPHMMAPFIVGRQASVRALEEALTDPRKRIFLVTQRDPKVDEPGRGDLYDMGVVAKVIQNLKLPNGNVKVMVEGVQRAKLLDVDESGDGFTATVEAYRITYPLSDKLQVYMGKVLSTFEHYAKVSHHLAFESLISTLKLEDPDRFTDTLAAHLMVSTTESRRCSSCSTPTSGCRSCTTCWTWKSRRSTSTSASTSRS